MDNEKKVDNDVFLDYLDAFVTVTRESVSIYDFDQAKGCVLVSRHGQEARIGSLSLVSLRNVGGEKENACTFALETAPSEAIQRYAALIEKLVAQIPLDLWALLIPLCIDDNAAIHSSECDPAAFRSVSVSLKDFTTDVTTESYSIYYDRRLLHYVLEIMFHPFANRNCLFSISLTHDKADVFYAAVLRETVQRAADAANAAADLSHYVAREWQRVARFDGYPPVA